MRPGEILDSRNDLLDRLQHSADFREQVAFMLASQAGDAPSNAINVERAVLVESVRRHMPSVNSLANHVKIAEVYRVTEDMTSMVEFAASQLDDSDIVARGLAPSPCGFVRFDKPLPVKDARGKTMLIHWFTWGPFRNHDGRLCTVVWAFNDPKTKPDWPHQEMRRLAEEDGGRGEWYDRFVGRFATVGASFLFDGQQVGSMEAMPSPRQAAEIMAEGFDPVPGTNDVRYIHALWMLLGQTITFLSPEDVDRPARRRARRMKLPEAVTVIRLRRGDSSQRPEGESMVEWHHKWIVRGHPRWQPYGSRRVAHEHVYGQVEVQDGTLVKHCVHEGCDHHLARIWIAPYVKGPEDAPLKQSEKVHSLQR